MSVCVCVCVCACVHLRVCAEIRIDNRKQPHPISLPSSCQTSCAFCFHMTADFFCLLSVALASAVFSAHSHSLLFIIFIPLFFFALFLLPPFSPHRSLRNLVKIFFPPSLPLCPPSDTSISLFNHIPDSVPLAAGRCAASVRFFLPHTEEKEGEAFLCCLQHVPPPGLRLP